MCKKCLLLCELIHKKCHIRSPQEFAKNVNHSYCSVHTEFKLADMNMVKVVNKWLSNFALNFLIFTSLKEATLKYLNYVETFLAYAGPILP